MKRFFSIIILLLTLFYAVSINAQSIIHDENFRSPLDIPLYLSGTFGELRSNHFHSGIDIKTGGVSGKKVFAIEDGYISRIKVSIWGYGKALYITHPNGYVSVYGHLKSFNDSIDNFVRNEQYRRKTYEIEIFPKKNELKVKKGDVIAFSGNSGGSAGPHLHFEIRKASDQHPVNPLLFKNIKIKDIIKPRIKKLAIYPYNDSSVINDYNDTLFFDINGWGNNQYIKGKPEIKIHGKVWFGIKSYDLMDGMNNKNGIYSQQIYIDSNLVFSFKMDEISFSTTRYINSFIDYSHYKNKNEKLIETKLDTNNRLKIYDHVKNNGIFEFSDTTVHDINVIVKDTYGNKSKLEFKIKGYKPDTVIRTKKENSYCDTALFVKYNKKFSYETENVKIYIPPDALYNSRFLYFGTDTLKKNNFLSNVYCIGSNLIPLQKFITLYIKPDTVPVDSLTQKLFIAIVDNKGQGWYYGGTFDNDFIKVKTKNFGKYTVMADTVKPVIKPLNFKDGSNIANRKYLKLKIKDDISGIKRYAAFLNDKWILMEYEPKKDLIYYRIDNLMKKGKNILKVYVFDNCENKAVYESFINY